MTTDADAVLIGGRGLIGSAVRGYFEDRGQRVLAVHRDNYEALKGASAKVLINCNGNPFRFKANQNPVWDFDCNVESVMRSTFDFHFAVYVFVSTIDVYDVVDDPTRNHEEASITSAQLDAYGFHKWIAERVVERYCPQHLILRVGTAIGPGLKKGPLFDLLKEQPLHMALDSRLSFVQTRTIAEAVHTLLKKEQRGIFNLTGSGSAGLMQFEDLFPQRPKAVDEAQQTYRYDINVEKLARIMKIGSSYEEASSFLKGAL